MWDYDCCFFIQTERYEHAKTKLQLIETKDKVHAQQEQIEFLKNELDKERSAYGNV